MGGFNGGEEFILVVLFGVGEGVVLGRMVDLGRFHWEEGGGGFIGKREGGGFIGKRGKSDLKGGG